MAAWHGWWVGGWLVDTRQMDRRAGKTAGSGRALCMACQQACWGLGGARPALERQRNRRGGKQGDGIYKEKERGTQGLV